MLTHGDTRMPRIAHTLLVMVPLLGACGGAQLVRGDPHGGEVALDGAYTSAVPEARAVMAAHCQGRYVVAGSARGSPTVPPDEARVAFTCLGAEPSPRTEFSESRP